MAPDGTISATIFAEMSALAEATGAINLGQGFPDEDGPDEVIDAARRAIKRGVNQYPPGRGTLELRTAIAEHQKRFYTIDVEPDTEVLVTAGATEALAATILSLVDEGDEVVTLEPFYDAYGALISLARGEHRTVPLRLPDFQPDPDDLRAAITDRTRLILINSPHNPTGTILGRDTLELIVELAHEHDALIVTDEVYEHLTFDEPHVPIASLPGAWERTITISSGGKTFSTTGWKIGWITGPATLITAILTVKQFLTYVNGAPFQPAIATGLALPDEFFTDIAATLKNKRDVLSHGLEKAGFEVFDSKAGYFVVADAAPLGYDNAITLCRELPELAGVVAVPISAFCHEELAGEYSSLVRFAFCKRVEVLELAAAQLARLGR
ncbi:MAG: aminotransferase [Subtercola sp.]|nr:aminotransferase [Subtercola sp.]